MLDCKASGTDDATVDPRFGKMGKQVCTDTGPLTKKRMETIDDDTASRAVDFIQRQHRAGQAGPHTHRARFLVVDGRENVNG